METGLKPPPPGTPPEVVSLFNEGNRLWRLGQLPDAQAAYRRALELSPDFQPAALNLGNVCLALGEDAEGWALYQHRPEHLNTNAHRLGFPEWRGEPLDGKRLFIWVEQGLGDQIFAARYLAGLPSRTTLVCQPATAPLFASLCDRVEPWRDPMVIAPEYDFWTLPLCLPQWATPSPGPYLSAPAVGTGRVGVMWRGNQQPDPGRSLPPELAQRLLSIPGAVSLQPEDTGAASFQDTASIIAGLDLVISIDTSVAHLTGAMGKRGIVLLQHHQSDWRWRNERPWYDSLELRRQPEPGAWEPLIEDLIRSVG